MEMKTQITLDWHLGIPDGEKTYSKLFDFTDDKETLKEYALQTAIESDLTDDPELIYADDVYQLTIRYNSTHYDSGEVAAKVEVNHFLKAGNTYFKLELADS